MELVEEKQPSWLEHALGNKFALNIETITMVVIIILAVFSRLYGLGARVMSHDENTHVYYSWRYGPG